MEPQFGDRLRSGEVTFQQDNAKIHTSKLSMDWMEDHGWQNFRWPPNSCDFSPIEFLWAIMAAELDRNWRPKNLSQLKNALEWIWPEVTKKEVLERCWARALTNMLHSFAADGDNTYHRDQFKPRRTTW